MEWVKLRPLHLVNFPNYGKRKLNFDDSNSDDERGSTQVLYAVSLVLDFRVCRYIFLVLYTICVNSGVCFSM